MIRRPAILVIDDDRTMHKIVERALQDFAGTLLHAYDGVEGLRMAREIRPKVVLTDALLPKLHGREVALRLKSDLVTHPINVVGRLSTRDHATGSKQSIRSASMNTSRSRWRRAACASSPRKRGALAMAVAS